VFRVLADEFNCGLLSAVHHSLADLCVA